eukprot:UN05473
MMTIREKIRSKSFLKKFAHKRVFKSIIIEFQKACLADDFQFLMVPPK